jgi:hypothetical protein
MTAIRAKGTAGVDAKGTAGVDVKPTYDTAALDVSIGRIAVPRVRIFEGLKSPPKQALMAAP